MQFRLNPIGIVSDMKQTSLNVQISDNKDFFIFLCYANLDENFENFFYNFLTVIFAATSRLFYLMLFSFKTFLLYFEKITNKNMYKLQEYYKANIYAVFSKTNLIKSTKK